MSKKLALYKFDGSSNGAGNNTTSYVKEGDNSTGWSACTEYC